MKIDAYSAFARYPKFSRPVLMCPVGCLILPAFHLMKDVYGPKLLGAIFGRLP
jgi:hypothetical protein